MNATLISACQMFLVPMSILFAALGVASTEGLKTGISIIGVITSAAWLLQLIGWSEPGGKGLSAVEFWTTAGLAATFVLVWVVSLVYHGTAYLKGDPLKTDGKQQFVLIWSSKE